MKPVHTYREQTDLPVNANLVRLGWSSFFQDQLTAQDLSVSPARVVGMRKNFFLISQGEGEATVTVCGSLVKDPAKLYPAVGDWVVLRDSSIVKVLARQNALVRKESGARKGKHQHESPGREQVIAANLDRVYVVCGLDRDFNLRRIERYLTLVYNCGITPEIILTKADLHADPTSLADEVGSIAFGVPLHLVFADAEEAILRLRTNLVSGETAALVGSSGAGKSTLINRIYGQEIQATGVVSESLGKGKHTTTNRDLIVLPTGGMLIDNPGIREVALTAGDAVSVSAFPDIEEIAMSCKYPDCTHTHEPGCAVVRAVAGGTLDSGRLGSYQKIKDELSYFSDRESKSAARVEKERWKPIAQKIKSMQKGKRHG